MKFDVKSCFLKRTHDQDHDHAHMSSGSCLKALRSHELSRACCGTASSQHVAITAMLHAGDAMFYDDVQCLAPGLTALLLEHSLSF